MTRMLLVSIIAGVFAFCSLALAGEGPAAGAVTDYHFDKPPQPLDSLKGVHPRLYLTKERIQELRRLIREDKVYAALFQEVVKKADRGVTSGPPQYVLDDGWSGTEQLWQREVGEMIPELAMAYCLSGEKKYLDSAKDWMLASLAYKTWGLAPFEGNDLAAGHELYGIAVAYDWLYGDLDEATRKSIRESLSTRAEFMYKVAATGEAYWADSYLQNHLWVNITGLAAVGFALYGEVDGAERWVKLPLDKYRTTFGLLPSDGSSFEGVPYWGYGVEYILKFTDLARGLLGEDFYRANEFFRNTTYFRLYSSLPRDVWTRKNNLMSYGDSPRFDWYGPDYLLRKFAGEYRDGHAQWLANAVDEAKVNAYISAFLNVLWSDPSVEARSPGDLPAFKCFDDLGIVFMRSGWTGEETECSFKCGPHVGRHALDKLSEDPGSGHVHPDEGSFQIFAYGDWLIVNDGYTWKTTQYENTLLVNGVGQEGEGYAWFRGDVLCKEKRAAKILKAATSTDVDLVIGDATAVYKKEAGLRKFIRSFYYLKPSTWVVVDEVAADAPSTFEFYFHGDAPFVKVSDNSYESRGKKAALHFVTVMPEGIVATAFKQELKAAEGEALKNPLETLKIANAEKAASAVFVNVLYACPVGSSARASAAIEEAGGRTWLNVKTPDRTWRFELELNRTDPAAPVLVNEGPRN